MAAIEALLSQEEVQLQSRFLDDVLEEPTSVWLRKFVDGGLELLDNVAQVALGDVVAAFQEAVDDCAGEMGQYALLGIPAAHVLLKELLDLEVDFERVKADEANDVGLDFESSLSSSKGIDHRENELHQVCCL